MSTRAERSSASALRSLRAWCFTPLFARFSGVVCFTGTATFRIAVNNTYKVLLVLAGAGNCC